MRRAKQRGIYESNGFSEEDLPQVQDRAAQGRGARDLRGSTAQAAPRVRTLAVLVDNTLLNQL
jgi:hypothetical protein